MKKRFSVRAVAAAAVAAVAMSGVAVVVSPAPAFAIAVPPCDDHTFYWNDVLLAAFKQQTGANATPTALARAGAMMHLAMYDTAVSLGMTGAPYIAKVPKTPNFNYSPTMNYDAAAATVLRHLFPSFDVAQYQTVAGRSCVLGEPGPEGFTTDVAQTAARNIINARTGDGSGVTTAYPVQATTAGQWRPTEPNTAAVSPNWGRVKPFALASGSQFRPPLPGGFSSLPAMLASPAYAQQVNEVRRVGSATASTADRTADQTVAAHFWANDLDGTYKPPGHLYRITQEIVKVRPTNRIKLFALLSLAMADTAVAVWDSKYETSVDLWRPDSAIAEPQTDGNAATTPDAAWQPLSKNRSGASFSPPFPAYTSGHAGFGGAWAGILKRHYGTDAVTYTAPTDDPFAPNVTRTFTSFSAAATENALSRIWLGVHFRWDADNGLAVGDQVAGYVFANRLR